MMRLTEINLIVADLERAHAFYTALGCRMRAITLPDSTRPVAWMTVEGPIPAGLHTADFAAWWDPSAPPVAPGSTTIDLTVDSAAAADDLVAVVLAHGGSVVAPPRTMPWGQRYGIVADPDGHRWGLRSEPVDDDPVVADLVSDA